MFSSDGKPCEDRARTDFQRAVLLSSAISSAYRALGNFEAVKPDDARPRQALLAAVAWEVKPTTSQLAVVESRMAAVGLSLLALDQLDPSPVVVAAECAAMAVEMVGFTIAEPDDIWWPSHAAIDAATSVAFGKCPVIDDRWFASFWSERQWQQQNLIDQLRAQDRSRHAAAGPPCVESAGRDDPRGACSSRR